MADTRNFTTIPEDLDNRSAVDQAIQEVLSSTLLGSFAAVSPDGAPWSWTAYFSYSKVLDIYTFSPPDAQHSQYLREHPGCSSVIANTQQTSDGGRRGLQLLGTCTFAVGSDLLAAFESYRARFPQFSDALQSEASLERTGWTSRMWVFRPKTIKVFYEPLLGTEQIVTIEIAPKVS